MPSPIVIDRPIQIEKRTGSTAPRSRIREVKVAALADALGRSLEGEVRFDAGSRALYSISGAIYRQVPIGVVLPKTIADVLVTVETCRRYVAPILCRGGGTSLAGQMCNVAVVMDCSKYLNRILALDPQRQQARVQPGVVLDTLRQAAERHHLTFGPDPATHNHCTLGGMIGNNSCGVHSLMAGKTDDNVVELDVLTYEGLRLRVGKTTEDDLAALIRMGGVRGTLYRRLRDFRDRYADLIRSRFPAIPRRVSGYNLPALLPEHGFDIAKALVGSEGTCVTILEATVRLVHSPPHRVLLVLGYRDIFEATDDVPHLLEYGAIGLEGFDQRLAEDIRLKGLHAENLTLLPTGGAWLLMEFGGETEAEASARAKQAMTSIGRRVRPPSTVLYTDPNDQHHVWKARESGLGATARVPGRPDTWEGWEDSAVPPEKLGTYLREFAALRDRYRYSAALYGHFGQGCVHTRLNFDFTTRDGIATYRSFIAEAVDLVVGLGGSLSGEHGDGQARAEFLPRMFGDELANAFREFKAIWDPDGKMNPHKLVDPYRIDENLRFGPDYNPPDVRTAFAYSQDDRSFARATTRCVGVGECRREQGGTMCPSYRATREEMHSTRGRARLLWEMLEGDPIRDGWRDEHVHDALHLCLACKGCKNECPVNVDMATYKAEFLSHYYAGRLRPPAAYSMGLIYWWARLASTMPGLANLVTQTPGLRHLVQSVGGISPHRRMPPFATRTFTDWFRSRRPQRAGGLRVLLWPDTFNNYFFPETAAAAVEVLEAAGFHVTIPPRPLCCGRPLYDFGMLDLAKSLWRQTLTTLRADIRAGIPVIGLEPSCVAAFRDELTELYPNDHDARRLHAQTFTLSEFLMSKAGDVALAPLHRRAVVHGHCHHKAVMGFGAERKLLDRLQVDGTILDSGCCGMAGSFGFKPGDHYEVSMQIGEQVLLPAVRKASRDTVIIADGFSCREQIAQATDRRALHLAQVMQMALREGPDGPRGPYPERRYFRPPPFHRAMSGGEAMALMGAGALLAAVWTGARRVGAAKRPE